MTSPLLFVLTATVVALIAVTLSSYSQYTCVDGIVTINDDFDVDVCQLFHSTYAEAREAFVHHASREATNATHTSLTVYENYTMDVVVLEGSEPGLVVHTSGVHGVEGYAGSATQLAYLQHHQRTSVAHPRRPTIILVHAFNPYGMAHYRRVNEENVDLNRNGLTPELWKTFAGVNHYNRDAYDQFDPIFNPTYMNLFLAYVTIWPKMLWYVLKHSIPTLKAAMVGSQYHQSRGIFYGGARTQASYVVLEEWLQQYLMNTTTTMVTWIDVHTGLGPRGRDSILGSGNALAVEVASVFPRSLHPTTSAKGQSVYRGYEQVKGFMGDYFGPMFHSSSLFVAQEFGTIRLPRVAHALIVENAAFHYFNDHQDHVEWWALRFLRPAFDPQSTSWRKSIVERGMDVLSQGIDHVVARHQQRS